MDKSMRDLNESIKEAPPLDKILGSWPQKPKGAAVRLREYYGEPDEYSESQLLWYNTEDGWKRTLLSKEEIPHNFPSQHTDFLEQFIDYKVPVEMFSALAAFDGSVIVERTKGEISARCAGTSMNFAAINLAHDIVTGTKTVTEARKEYTKLYKAFQEGEKPSYTQSFEFELPVDGTRDLDVVTL